MAHSDWSLVDILAGEVSHKVDSSVRPKPLVDLPELRGARAAAGALARVEQVAEHTATAAEDDRSAWGYASRRGRDALAIADGAL